MLYTKDLERFSRAAALAENGQHRAKVGCVAVVGGKIVSGAFNTFRNSQKTVPFSYATYHAETNTIAGIPYEGLTKATLYIARVSAAGKLLASHPCWRCVQEIQSKGIKSVVYYDGKKLIKQKSIKLTPPRKLS